MRSQDGLAVTLRDISDLKAHEQAMVRLANEDLLTGLPNRNWLTSNLTAAIDTARTQSNGLGFLLVDLDNFKDINDTLGLAIGDELLRSVAARLQEAVGSAGRVTRQGGDEFGIVMPSVSDRSAVAAMAEGIFIMPAWAREAV